MSCGCDGIAVSVCESPCRERSDYSIQHGYPIVHLGHELTPEAIERLGETGWFRVWLRLRAHGFGRRIIDYPDPILRCCGSIFPDLFPAERIGDLLGERQRVKGLEKNRIYAQVRESALIVALHLGGKQDHGDVRG